METQNGTREQTKNKKNAVSVTLKRVFKNKKKKIIISRRPVDPHNNL